MIKIVNKIISKKKPKEKNKEEEEEEEEKSIQITQIIIDCYEKSDNTFDFSLFAITFLIFIYLTLGVIIFAQNQNNMDIVDYYYFNIISLLKIGIGDLTINLKNSSITYLIIFYIYIIIGISFFLMIIESLKCYIKLILIKTGHNITFEVLKFATQLGYNIELHINDESSSAVNINDLTNNTTNTSVSSNNNNDDVFYQQNQSSNRYKSSFKIATNIPNKRKSLLKDLNDSNGLDNLKFDKQTQITTLLCSKYKNELTNIVEPIVKINSTINNQVSPILEKIKVNDEDISNSYNTMLLNANAEPSQKQSSPLNTRRTRFENKTT